MLVRLDVCRVNDVIKVVRRIDPYTTSCSIIGIYSAKHGQESDRRRLTSELTLKNVDLSLVSPTFEDLVWNSQEQSNVKDVDNLLRAPLISLLSIEQNLAPRPSKAQSRPQ